MKINDGVSLSNLCPQMVIACMVIEPLAKAHGQDLIITCGSDGTHSSRNSKHHIGCALDFRTWFISDRKKFEEQVQAALTPEYFVLMEHDHLHVQWNGSLMP